MALFDVSGEVATNPRVHNAIILANIVLHHDSFQWRVAATPSFFNTNESGVDVIHRILDKSVDPAAKLVTMSKWKRIRPWYRNTTAETNGSIIELNPSFYMRSYSAIVNTLVHEWLHAIGYSHVWNNPSSHPIILKSVNYVVGKIAEEVAHELISGKLTSHTFDTLIESGAFKYDN